MPLLEYKEVELDYKKQSFRIRKRAKIHGAGSWTDFVTDINYDEKGQRTKIVYANGAQTK